MPQKIHNKKKKIMLDVNMGSQNNIEGFDGIKKTNSRLIFGILLTFIIIDFIYICYN